MLRTEVTLSAAGYSPWIPVDRVQPGFAIGLFCTITSGASLTYAIQHTGDDLYAVPSDITISRTTTTATVTLVDHRLTAGDSVIISGTGNTNFDGTQNVASIVDADNFTYTVANSGAASGVGKAVLLRVFDHPTITAKTAKADGYYNYPPAAIRLRISSYTSGKVTMRCIQGIQK